MIIPQLSISFDTTSLATLENEASIVEENFIKIIIAGVYNGNNEPCKISAKLVTPDMISDLRYKEIYQLLLLEPELKYLSSKLNTSKSVFINLLQTIQKEKLQYSKTVLISIIEQIRDYYISRLAINKLQALDKCHSLDKIIETVNFLKEDLLKSLTVDKETHPLTIGSLDPEDFSQEIEWLIPDILFPQSINVFYGPPSHGKSILALTLGVELLRRNLIDNLVYLDGDNPLVILKYRKLDDILSQFNSPNNKRIIYHNISYAEVMQRLLQSVINFPGRNLIVIDSLKDLAGNLNLNDQRDSTYLQTLIQRVRNGSKSINMNTIIVLHHENKNKQAKGNGVFLDGADCSYQFSLLTKNNNSLNLKIINKKSRLPVKTSFDLKIYPDKNIITEIIVENNQNVQIQAKDRKNVLAIKTYLQRRYEIGAKYISITEISEKLNISEKTLKKYGKDYNGGLWIYEDNSFMIIPESAKGEVDLWTKEPFIESHEKHTKKIKAIFS